MGESAIPVSSPAVSPAELRREVDVLVVGGGPPGLTAANLLGTLGVSALLVEQNPSTSDEPKAARGAPPILNGAYRTARQSPAATGSDRRNETCG